ncbi:DUF397 domain-containing protein [Streptomyces sp. NA02950]|uniref:DUF397 domain-containing protein n=1 Tax=Streptomyces sp. NA02950 TaxID=2742137 RepID=UPI00159064AD|nr:DUF397 domain-containing protein [Streptomyces sp. NA02950]QKV94710.1 DUF397 domain-containing protein [Streptomyces sp. NA02950]
MDKFDFVNVALCRDAKVGNCPQVAVNVPGVVAIRDSERPAEVVTMTLDGWRDLTLAVKAGKFDLGAA